MSDAPKQHVDEVQAVGHQDADPVSAFDAERYQRPANPARSGFELAVSRPLINQDDAVSLGVRGGTAQQ